MNHIVMDDIVHRLIADAEEKGHVSYLGTIYNQIKWLCKKSAQSEDPNALFPLPRNVMLGLCQV